MAIDPVDLGNINDAPSIGTPSITTKLAAQNSNAGDTIQSVAIGDLAYSTNAVGVTLGARFLSPAGFNLSLATSAAAGIMKGATDAEIIAGTAFVALTADKQTELFQENIRSTGDYNNGDIDALTEINPGSPTSTGVLDILNCKASTFGTFAFWNGDFTYNPTTNSARVKIIYLNNGRQPLYAQSGWGHWIDSAEPTKQWPMSVLIEADGTEADGIGRVKISIGTGEGGLNFNTAKTYNLKIGTQYFGKF